MPPLFFSALLAFALFSSVALASPFPSSKQPFAHDIPRLSGIAVDGDTSDWGSKGFRVEAFVWQTPAPGEADFQPRFRLGWDEQGLLVLAEVQDDVAVEQEAYSEALGADAVSAFLGNWPSEANALLAIIQPGLDPRFGKAHGQAFQGFSKRTVEYAARRVAGGYVVETRLPWKECHIEPREGLLIGCYLKASDCDAVADKEGKGGDKALCAWAPLRDGGCLVAQSSMPLRLSRGASRPVELAASVALDGRYRTKIRVYAPAWAGGRTVRIRQGWKTLASATLQASDGVSSAVLDLAALPAPRTWGRVEIAVRGCDSLSLETPNLNEARARLVHGKTVQFTPSCFAGAMFPGCNWMNPFQMEEDVLGPYDIHTTYYNTRFEKVDAPREPGRYGAVVEIAPKSGGRPIRRYRTLYCMPKAMLAHMQDLGVTVTVPAAWNLKPNLASQSESVLADYLRARLNESFWIVPVDSDGPGLAGFFAALDDASTTTLTFDFSSNPEALDRQWWVSFKRKHFGMDRQYSAPFVCPRPMEGKPAPVVREGSLGEAGMKPETARNLDALCREWSEKGKDAFSVCVVRHGVVVQHQAFGKDPEGKPVLLENPSWMASLTKLMSGTMMMTFVDQGLVDLDDRVDKYLPQLRDIPVETPLTVRHLYTHTNGFWDHFGDEQSDLEERVADYYPYLKIGKKHYYNGIGYAIGGKVMEMVSGEALPGFYRRHLLDPLGCAHTKVIGTNADARSVPLDMARIGQLLLNRGAYGSQRFYRAKTFEKQLPKPLTGLLGPDVTMDWGIGLVWFDDKELSDRTIGHGALSGVAFRVDLKNDLVIVMVPFGESPERDKYFHRFLKTIVDGIADAQPVTRERLAEGRQEP